MSLFVLELTIPIEFSTSNEHTVTCNERVKSELSKVNGTEKIGPGLVEESRIGPAMVGTAERESLL
jgi:hypothetical protein